MAPRIAVPGTEPPAPGADVLGDVAPTTVLAVTVLVRPRQPLPNLLSTGDHSVMSREAFAASYGADPQDLASVEAFARAHGLEIVETSKARRSITLRGTAAAFGEAFGIRIRRYRDANDRTFRAPDGPIYVPTELDGVVQGVFGFDDRPLARR